MGLRLAWPTSSRAATAVSWVSRRDLRCLLLSSSSSSRDSGFRDGSRARLTCWTVSQMDEQTGLACVGGTSKRCCTWTAPASEGYRSSGAPASDTLGLDSVSGLRRAYFPARGLSVARRSPLPCQSNETGGDVRAVADSRFARGLPRPSGHGPGTTIGRTCGADEI
ncbi:PREDICTED: uncharacterized protein LOC105365224 [Ceratosolen solmsi marchali]|uniref:Uncharacterized protein LOC105365224 n=1 Tax=Ceratosolen solmsi marchali TaxID=326594 RepID=A0AAJ6YP40_9HYME|nr:PREDICTED: uncharacterized protein LOC105365224 [Ceratosolen solmsi marchali]